MNRRKYTSLNHSGYDALLMRKDVDYALVFADATETPIERPKQNKSFTIQKKEEKTYIKNSNIHR